MKKNIYIFVSVIFLTVLFLGYSVYVIAYSSGITGKTKKTSTTGCSCHTNNTAITGGVTGPDTVQAGATVVYTVTINRSGYTGTHGGVDIATRLGALGVISNLQLLNSELTHTSPLTFTSGTVAVTFNYTASASAGIDTIWSSLVAGYSNGWNWGTDKRVVVINPTGIINNQTASNFALNQNYPNPFNPSTTITFDLPKTSDVSLVIFDITGKKIDEVVRGTYPAGKHEYNWVAQDYASGIYYYVLKAGNYVDTKKMMLVK